MNTETEATAAHGDPRKAQSNRDKRLAKKRRWAAEREELARHRSTSTTGSKGNPSPKGKGKGKSKDQSGLEICYSWASGRGPCVATLHLVASVALQ